MQTWREEVQHSLLMTHWGHRESEPECTWKVRMAQAGWCLGDHDGTMTPRPGLPCHVPWKDVVIPVPLGDGLPELSSDMPRLDPPMVPPHPAPRAMC